MMMFLPLLHLLVRGLIPMVGQVARAVAEVEMVAGAGMTISAVVG